MEKKRFADEAEILARHWKSDERWSGIKRGYSAEDVIRLQPSIRIEHSISALTSRNFWKLVHGPEAVRALGALSGNQAVQMVRGGLQALYLSGWQVAADANLAGQTYPDQSLYPSNSVAALVKRINNALLRADQIERSQGKPTRDWMVPIVADAEAGFGGPLHAFELTKGFIEAGVACAHFEDQTAAEKKCGHLGGKVLVPTAQFIRTLTAARLASDVMGVPMVLIARTDSLSATLLTSDIDPYDRPFLTGERTSEGFYRIRPGLDSAIARGLAYAPHADMLWFETSTPDLGEARAFAEAIHQRFPGKLLGYNCSPSFNWKRVDQGIVAKFHRELNALGYKFQFITLAGWHSNSLHSFELAKAYVQEGMPGYVRLQEREFAAEPAGYTAVKHQQEVGTTYFDDVLKTVTGGDCSTAALEGSTELAQFRQKVRSAA